MVFDRRPTSPGTDRPSARSLTELLRSFASDAAGLVRQEIALARLELKLAARRLVGAAGRVAVGGGIALLGLLTVIAGVVVLLGELMGSYWGAALVVGGVLLLAGGLIARGGARGMQSADPVPRMAIESAQDTAAWARREIASLRATLFGRRDRASPPRPTLPAGAEALPATLPAASQADRPKHGTALVPTSRSVPAGRLLSDRGQVADSGRHAPPRSAGTLAFLKHVAREVQDDDIPGHAAKLAYYSFLALPPAMMALFGLAGLVGSFELASWLETQARMALPPAVTDEVVTPFIQQVVLERAPGPFSIGLLLALWGGSSLFVGLIDTLNHAYDIEEDRSFIRKRALALATMLGSVLLFGGAAAALLLGPVLIEAVGMGEAGAVVWNLARWPLAFVFMVAAFWCAYYFLPNRDQRGASGVLVRAAAVAAALWVLATTAFRLYIANFSSYSETYGFLGAFIILLLWLYVTGLVVLAGGELASEMERRPS